MSGARHLGARNCSFLVCLCLGEPSLEFLNLVLQFSLVFADCFFRFQAGLFKSLLVPSLLLFGVLPRLLDLALSYFLFAHALANRPLLFLLLLQLLFVFMNEIQFLKAEVEIGVRYVATLNLT